MIKYVLIVYALTNYGQFERVEIPALEPSCRAEMAVIDALNKLHAQHGKIYHAYCQIHSQ
jgi:hypothetical protein